MIRIFDATKRIAFLAVAALVFAAGCESEGPAERAGKQVDEGVQKAKDVVSPPGPLEKAGREVDKNLSK